MSQENRNVIINDHLEGKMRFLEYGDKSKEKIVLIHGAVISWQMWLPMIEHFTKRYFIIIPVLDGHDVEQKSDFQTIDEAAEQIENYYIQKYGNEVFSVCGMSMGGSIASKLLVNKRLYIKRVIMESTPLIPLSKWLSKFWYNMSIKQFRGAKQRDEKVVKLYNTIYPKELLPYIYAMIDHMGEQTVKNNCEAVSTYHFPKDLDLKDTEVHFWYGTKTMEVMAIRSSKYINKWYPEVQIKKFSGYNHCELSVNHAEQYIGELEKVFEAK